MNLFILHYYTVVCETGSMARAAEKLSLSRQALSKAILTLESEVGAHLLTRRSSGVVPTPSGEVLLRHARILLRDWDAALAELETVRRNRDTVLRVGYGQMTYNLWEAGHAEVFAKANPHLQFSYRIMPPDQLLKLLSAGDLDLIVSSDRGQESQFASVLLRELPLFVILSREDPLSRKLELGLEDLDRHPVILSVSSGFSDALRRSAQEAGIQPDFRPFPSHDPLTILRTVRSTGGAYLTSKLHLLYQGALEGLSAVPFRQGDSGLPTRDIYASALPEFLHTPAIQSYIRHLSPHAVP